MIFFSVNHLVHELVLHRKLVLFIDVSAVPGDLNFSVQHQAGLFKFCRLACTNFVYALARFG